MNQVLVGGRYRTTRLLGTGGMGAVYEATDTATGYRVAVKIVTADVARDDVLMSRFEREAQAAMAIDTPHIVRTYATGRDTSTGLPFAVMELLEGEDGRQLMKRLGQLPYDLALRIVAQACLGLQKAHEHNIIHRDIKPANFFLTAMPTRERLVKLLDFGIAKLKRDPNDKHTETAGLTMTGSLLGSPLYMSPEQARGHKDIDFRADIWSLGIVLYQALTGRTPYQDNDALGDLIIAICTETPEPVQHLAPWVPPEVAAVVHRALRIDPAERFQSANEMLSAIALLIPGDWTIREDMLRPVTDVERSSIAPRIVPPEQNFSRSQSGSRNRVSATGSILPGAIVVPGGHPIPPAAGSSPGGVPAVAVTGSGMHQSQSALGFETPHSLAAFGSTSRGGSPAQLAPQAGGGRAGLIAAGAVLALLVGGTAAYALIIGKSPASPAQGGETAASAAPASGPSTRDRTVKVVIIPGDADVEIEGSTHKPKDGVIEIKGPPGSVHRVRLKAGGAEMVDDVVVTENGAIPPKLELRANAASGASTTPAATTAPATEPKTYGPSAPKPKTTSTSAPPPSDIFFKR
jgi:serine/threonine protein kinase